MGSLPKHMQPLHHSHSEAETNRIKKNDDSLDMHHSHSEGNAQRSALSHVKEEPFYSSTSSIPWAGGLVDTGSRATGLDKIGRKHRPYDEKDVVDRASPDLSGRVTLSLVITAAVTAFGSSFPHGWNTGVLNAPAHLIKDFLNESYWARFDSSPNLNLIWSMTVSIYLVGGCAGAFSAGWFANKFGRRTALLVLNVFGLVSAVLFGLCDFAGSFEMLIIGRLLVGYGCGAGSGLVPMFLVEIAPINVRGAMGVVHQFALTCGILVSQLIGLRQVLGNEDMWPYLLALTGIPCVVSLVVLPWFPESPRYLYVNKNDRDAAEKALQRFRGIQDVSADLNEMEREKNNKGNEKHWSFKQLLQAKNLRMPLLLVCALACCQQLSGINVVFYYSSTVFETSGIPEDKIQYAVLGTGIVNVIMTAVSVPLMEKSGRRVLLLLGMLVMAIAAVLITIALNIVHLAPWMSYVSVICTFAFIVGFAIGLGSIPQFIPAELFQQGPRPPAMSLAGFLNWLCNFTIGIVFPFMDAAMKGYSFLPFIAIVAAFGVFFLLKLPETKGKTYDEIQAFFDNEKEKTIPESESLIYKPGVEKKETTFTLDTSPNGHVDT